MILEQGQKFALVGLFGGKGQVPAMSKNKPPVPLSISYSSLDNSPADGTWNTTLGQEYEAIMKGRFRDTIKFIGRNIAGRIGSTPVSNESQIDRIMKKSGVEAAVGAMLEGSLGIAGAPYTNDVGKQNASIDFPMGLGKNLASLFGISQGIPTDATRDVKGKGISRFVGQISRYIEQQKKLSSPGLASNPNVTKLSSGGSVPALLTPGEFVINKNTASKIGSSGLHQLNRADKISGFNNGGMVKKFAGGGFASMGGYMGRVASAATSAPNPSVGRGGMRRLFTAGSAGGGMGGIGGLVGAISGGVAIEGLSSLAGGDRTRET